MDSYRAANTSVTGASANSRAQRDATYVSSKVKPYGNSCGSNRNRSGDRTASDQRMLLDALQLLVLAYPLNRILGNILSHLRCNFEGGTLQSSLLDIPLHHRVQPSTRNRRKGRRLVSPNRHEERTISMKCNNDDLTQIQRVAYEGRDNLIQDIFPRINEMTHEELQSWILKHSIPLEGQGQEDTMKHTSNKQRTDRNHLRRLKDSHIEIEVDLMGKNRSLDGFNTITRERTSSMPSVKQILNVVSLSNIVHQDGEPEVVLLFTAIRSDNMEVIIDNKYLRTMHPLLLVEFYEQRLVSFDG
ncbi:hypothetical protein KP509_39G010900 [Ceratopteris richardii]|nr:hypothetical protein KP509_39G010900 [Ceratopteris richardii]